MPRRSPFTSVTPALSIATSVPVPMAMPTCGLRERGSVVDAVAGHGDDAALGLQALRRPSTLLRGQHLGLDVRRGPACRATAAAVVRLSPVEHDDAHALLVQLTKSLGRRGLDRIGDAERARPAGRRPRRTSRSGRRLAAPRRARPARRRRCPAPSSRESVAEQDASGPRPCPTTPLPVTDSNSDAASQGEAAGLAAPATIAAASGCSLPCSTRGRQPQHVGLAASRPRPRRPRRLGLPSVSVPVLSTTSVSTFSKASSASASRISTPRPAPRPTPTMIDMGVASPRAQGHAMIRTPPPSTRAWARRGSGPTRRPDDEVSAAISDDRGHEVAGHRDRRAAGSAPGSAAPRPPCGRSARAACPRPRARRASPGRRCRSASRRSRGRRAAFSTGIGSPLIIDSSTELRPSITTPSTGTFSPGRTRRRSPGCTRSSGTSDSLAVGCR